MPWNAETEDHVEHPQLGTFSHETADLLVLLPANRQQEQEERLSARHPGDRCCCDVDGHGSRILSLCPVAGPILASVSRA